MKNKIILTVAFLFAGILVFAGVADSTHVQAEIDQINKGADAGLGMLLSLLVSKYPILAPFVGIISGVVMLLIRKIEKSLQKKKIAAEIKALDAAHPVAANPEHRNALRRLVDRLEGKK